MFWFRILVIGYVDVNKMCIPVHLYTITKRAKTFGQDRAGVSLRTRHQFLCSSVVSDVVNCYLSFLH